MKILIVLAFLAASVAASFDSVDFSKVLPREGRGRVPIIQPQGSLIEGRITNGQAAIAKQFPYQAGLLLEYPGEAFYWCGGILISKMYILTAAHCTDGVLAIRVTLGTLTVAVTEAEGEQVYEVEANNETVIVHAEYDDWTLTNDISLIQLPEEVTLSDYVKPVQLPSFTGQAPKYSHEVAIASGWGRVSDSSTSISPTLQWTTVPVTTNARCATYYGRLETSHLCIDTRETLQSTCNGDSGGPLVHKDTNVLIGVVSFGVSYGCEVAWPAGFARVTSFLPWIEKYSGVKP